jgi:general stress protein 26
MNHSDAEQSTIDVHAPQRGARRAAIARLGELVRDIQFAMLTTINARGHMHCRPMTTIPSELEDELWFYIDARSGLVDDITENHQVNLSYVEPRRRYVSVAGVAHVVRDDNLLKKLWHPHIAEWFPEGPSGDVNLALLRVQLEEAEYWDVAARTMVKLHGFDTSDERVVPPPVEPSATDPPEIAS